MASLKQFKQIQKQLKVLIQKKKKEGENNTMSGS